MIIGNLIFDKGRSKHLNGIEFKCADPCILILSLEFFLVDGKTKVSQNYIPIEADQDILWLQISVDNTFFMKLQECLGKLIAYFLSVAFLNRFDYRVGVLVEISI